MDDPGELAPAQQRRWHCLDHDTTTCKSGCRVQSMLSLFSRRHAMEMLRLLLMKGTLRFNQILEAIGGSPKTITDRLVDLVEAGLVRREAFAEIPPRVEYSLTARGKGLERVFEEISSWAVAAWPDG